MLLRDLIKKERAISLTPDDVVAMSYRKGLRAMEYDKITSKMSLKQLLPTPVSGVLILFTDHSKPDKAIGHFALLFRSEHGVFFFDPLGFGLSRILHKTRNDDALQRILGSVNYDDNTKAYQKIAEETQTCGRHCVTRYNCSHFNSKSYDMLMHHPSLDPDQIVVMLTMSRDLTKIGGK